MRRTALILLATATAATALVTAAPASAGHGALTVTGLTAHDRLITFRASDPGTILSEVRVTGLAAGEDLAAIDYRPRNGQLYGVATSGAGGALYTIDPATGAATPVPGAPVLPVSGQVSIDVNPVADALRVVDTDDNNLRLPFGTLVLARDGELAYAATDPAAGSDPAVGGAAYTNSTAAPSGTTLYDLDADLDALVLQAPPNAGTLTTVGDLPQGTKAQATGFDIYTRTTDGQNWAFVSLFDRGRSTFYEIDLATGQMITSAPAVPGSGMQIDTRPHVTDIALAPAQQGF
jgi:hypothetical protein